MSDSRVECPTCGILLAMRRGTTLSVKARDRVVTVAGGAVTLTCPKDATTVKVDQRKP